MPRPSLPHGVSLLLCCALAFLGASYGPGRTVAASAEEPPATEVRVGSYNIRAGMTASEFGSAVRALLPRVDVAGLQEVNSRDKEAVLAGLQGWSYFRAPRYYGEQRPVIWNDSAFDLVSARSKRVADAGNVGNELPGRSGYIRPQYVSIVRLVHRATGKNVSVVNLHLVPGAVRGGRRWPDRPRLFEYYADELVQVIKVTQQERQWGKTFVTGDYNAGWVADERWRKPRLPFRRFQAIGMKSMWATERPARLGTYNDALIDQVFSDTRASDAAVAFDLTLSDHRPAIALYQVPTPTS